MGENQGIQCELTMPGLMTKRKTVYGLALSACLITLLVPYSPAQQLDAKNWGKNSPGVILTLREGPRP
jgi:hypothetical protein